MIICPKNKHKLIRKTNETREDGLSCEKKIEKKRGKQRGKGVSFKRVKERGLIKMITES